MPEIHVNTTLVWCFRFLQCMGYWPPQTFRGWKMVAYYCYTFLSFVFILGIYILIQAVDMYVVWGNIPLMTSDAFLLFTNLAQTAKIVNLLLRQDAIQNILNNFQDLKIIVNKKEKHDIVNRYAWYAVKHLCFYSIVTFITVTLWALSPILSHVPGTQMTLPLTAWYPYKTDKSPAFELTYSHQMVAIYLAASMNVIKDSLVAGLMNQASCHLVLLKYDLAHLTEDLDYVEQMQLFDTDENDMGITINEDQCLDFFYLTESIYEKNIYTKMRMCIINHQKILDVVSQIEGCFSGTTFAQFSVSLVIICVTAFQLAEFIGNNIVQTFGIGIYLLNMMYQVFLYCSHGNEVTVQSKNVIVSAYCSTWYQCSPRLKSALLTLMMRSLRPARLTAGGFATLSIDTFVAIMKASYSFFTLLQQLNEPIEKN